MEAITAESAGWAQPASVADNTSLSDSLKSPPAPFFDATLFSRCHIPELFFFEVKGGEETNGV